MLDGSFISLKSKLYYGIAIIRKFNHFVPSYILKLIYFFPFLIIFLYNFSHVWGNTYKALTKLSIVAQNKALHEIFNINYISNVDNIYKVNTIMRFIDIVRLNAYRCLQALFVGVSHNIIQNLITTNKIRYFKKYPTYHLRNNIVFTLPHIYITYEQFNIRYVGLYIPHSVIT